LFQGGRVASITESCRPQDVLIERKARSFSVMGKKSGGRTGFPEIYRKRDEEIGATCSVMTIPIGMTAN